MATESITITFPGGADQYELAAFGGAQQTVDTRRAAIAEHQVSQQLEQQMFAAGTAYNQAKQKLSMDPNNPNLQIAVAQAQIAYTNAQTAFNEQVAKAAGLDAARSSAYYTEYNAFPGLLVNPGAIEQV